MSGCLNKLIPKMILIIVALLLVAAVGGAITEDGNQDAFDTAMEELPFAGPISKVLCNLMKLDKGEELLSANDLITDVLKVLIMSCIHPAIARILSRIFLKLPAGSVYDQEAYMETMSYRIKELVVLVLTAIPVAYLTGVGVGAAKNALEESIGAVLSSISLSAATIAVFFISVSLFLKGGVSFGRAVLIRIFSTVIGNLLKTIVVCVITIWIYLLIKQGEYSALLAAAAALFILLGLIECGVKYMISAIVR